MEDPGFPDALFHPQKGFARRHVPRSIGAIGVGSVSLLNRGPFFHVPKDPTYQPRIMITSQVALHQPRIPNTFMALRALAIGSRTINSVSDNCLCIRLVR